MGPRLPGDGPGRHQCGDAPRAHNPEGDGEVTEKPTLRKEVERRRGEVDEATQKLSDVEKRITAATGWFKKVAPKHIDAEQFTGLCIGAIRKGDKLLQSAVIQSPESFMQAVSDCAQLGLLPGNTYHFAPFWSSADKCYTIVGIVDYKGELDLIYRAGGVQSVHCHVV